MKNFCVFMKVLFVSSLLAGSTNLFATVSSFPYQQGFETDCLGSWTQNTDDNLNWTRRSGTTPSSSTGPSSASEGSFYMYIEASGAGYPSKTATVTSDFFDVSSMTNPIFSFSYHMYGSNMGSLYLEFSFDGSTWYPVFTKTGNQGNAWNGIVANLASYKSTPFKLRFRGVTGTGYRSDIAIDNLRFSEGPYTGGGSDPACATGGGSPCDNPTTAFPYYEGFELNFGDWSQNTDDNFNWTRRSGSTPSNSTGPSSAYAGSFYVYTEASGKSGQTATITSPCFDVSALQNPTFNWNYHMYGSSMGSLTLEISPDGTNWYQVWTKAGDQGNQWKGVNANLAAYKNFPFQLRFRGVMGTSFRSDIALDDIDFYDASAKSQPGEYVEVEFMTPVVDASVPEYRNLSLAPNPSTGYLSVQLELEAPTTAQVQVFSYTGQLMVEKQVNMEQGINTQEFDFDLPQGAYLLRVKANELVENQRFNIVR